MDFYVMTLFPELIDSIAASSILGRAVKKGVISIKAVNIRDYSDDVKHQSVDDYCYGGGKGMLMKAQPVYDCYQAVRKLSGDKARVVYLTPQGSVFTQEKARELSGEENLILLSGHYEGIDERVLDEIVTDRISIGDYVLTGGELPAMILIDAIARLVPGVLSEGSAEVETFHDGLLEYPQYTRPEVWMGKQVPEVLLSGHHQKVEEWQRRKSIERTLEHRPDLLKNAVLNKKEKQYLDTLIREKKHDN
ncbi:MAG: tRNA (guanosine(37)-N1)-methyltransferase TrmD [Lachnospiraceae bacterium]|nr:tRNA (guanosine(37)-N1)-methyltransferase TrmD [Lachnospiraceae bacterium]